MNTQEVIEEIKNLKGLTILDKTINFDSEMVSKMKVLNIVKQLDEPEKPVVPQYVADFYESIKDDFEDGVYDLFVEFCEDGSELSTELYRWFKLDVNKPIETLVKMKLFDYEVDKEKLYTVELPNPNAAGHVVLCKNSDGIVSITFASIARWRGVKNAQLTEEEIKQDFEWAWPFAIEVEE